MSRKGIDRQAISQFFHKGVGQWTILSLSLLIRRNIQDILFRLHCWYAVTIHKERWAQIKYLAVYESDPISAITYIAEVKGVECIQSIQWLQARVGQIKQEDIGSLKKEVGEKCVLYLDEKSIKALTTPIKKGKEVTRIRGRCYTNYKQLQHALQQKEPTWGIATHNSLLFTKKLGNLLVEGGTESSLL